MHRQSAISPGLEFPSFTAVFLVAGFTVFAPANLSRTGDVTDEFESLARSFNIGYKAGRSS